MSSRSLILILLAWGIPIFWVTAIPENVEPIKSSEITTERLKIASEQIKRFTTSYGEVPLNLSELRAFSKTKKHNIKLYDAFGNRFEYLRLGRQDFFMRSFGSDGLQNTVLSDPDFSIVSWSGSAQRGLRYNFLAKPEATLYPAILLAGAESPSGQWTAELFADPIQGVRRLVVRQRDPINELFLTAPHDQVEEFLWLPNGYQIIFSATSSQRYEDGVYIWNLLDDQVEPLLNDSNENKLGFDAKNIGKYHISLMGVQITGPTLYFYILPRTNNSLDPVAFHSNATLFSIVIPDNHGPQEIRQYVSKTNSKTFSAFDVIPSHTLHLSTTSEREIQNIWLKLPARGDIETVLSGWQEFAANNARSPLIPYVLWHLSCMYSDAYAVIVKNSPADAEVLRAVGTEMALKLVELPLAPSYLRAEGLYIHELLSRGESLPFRVSLQTIPPPKVN